MRRLVVFGLASALAACSIITGLNADYTRQDPETEGETGADGMVATDGNMSSSGSDANDATVMPSCSGLSFCDCYGDASNVAFCWDFEKSGASATAGFSGSNIAPGGGSLDLGKDGGVDGSTTYLIATIPNPGPTGSPSTYVRQELDQLDAYNTHDLSFAFAIFKSTLATTNIGSIGFQTDAGENVLTGVGDWYNESNVHIDISSPPGTNEGSDVIAPPGMWLAARVHLSRTGAGVPFTMEIFATDSAGLEHSVEKGLFDGGTGPTELLFGTYFSSPGDAGASVGIDNILYKRSN